MNPELENMIYTSIFSKQTQEFFEQERSKYFEEDFFPYQKHRIFTSKQKEECWKMVILQKKFILGWDN